jgi:hypothetical protein
VFTKTFPECIRFGATLGCSLMFAAACFAAGEQFGPLVRVSVYNEAQVAPAMLESAEATGTAVFERAGLKVQWLNCGLAKESAAEAQSCGEARFPTHVQLRILERSRGLREFTLGLSFLDVNGRGCYSDIFFAELQAISEKTRESSANILGHVMAHEIGHLLLGTNSHSALGLMKARWDAAELKRAGRGELLFTAQQAKTMLARLFVASAATRRERQGAEYLARDEGKAPGLTGGPFEAQR